MPDDADIMDDELDAMSDEPDREETPGRGRDWDAGSFTTGLLLGAAVGAGIALLFAPATGHKTRRRLRRGARELARGAGEEWESAREQVTAALQEKRAALGERLRKG